MGRLAGLLAAAILALTGGVSSAAEIPAPCLQPATDMDMTLAGLEREGWTILPGGTLTPSVADLLVWSYVPNYIGGDTGGEPLSTLLPLQARTVEGLARKRDIPSSKTRLARRDGAALAVFWRVEAPGRLEIQCRAAFVDPAAETPATEVARDPQQSLEDGFVLTTRLDAPALSARAGGVPVPTTVIDSTIRFAGEPAQ